MYVLFGFFLCALAKRINHVRLYNAARHSFRSGDPRVFSHYWKALDPGPSVWRFSLLVHGNTAWEVQLLWFVFMLYYKPVHVRVWRDRAWSLKRGWQRTTFKIERYMRKASKAVLMPSIDYTMRSLITVYEQEREITCVCYKDGALATCDSCTCYELDCHLVAVKEGTEARTYPDWAYALIDI
jgi:hypothetical protein